jgi:hypothetical protein
MSTELAMQAAAAFDAEVEIILDLRRSKDRARQAKHRANKEAASRDITLENVTNVTERDQDAPAHVRDNLPRLVTSGKISSAAGDCASDWPQDHPGGIAKHLASMAGPGLADIAKAPGLTTTAGEIIRWKQMGCSWALDVVPVIEGRTKNRRNSPISSWTLLTNDVLAAKARRERPIEMPDATGPPSGSLTERIGAENAEARRRAFARMDR